MPTSTEPEVNESGFVTYDLDNSALEGARDFQEAKNERSNVDIDGRPRGDKPSESAQLLTAESALVPLPRVLIEWKDGRADIHRAF